MSVLTNILTSKYYTHSVLHMISFAQNFTILCHFSQELGTGERKNVFISISKRGFKGESRRYIRLFPLPVSCGKPELFAVSLDKLQGVQRPSMHV